MIFTIYLTESRPTDALETYIFSLTYSSDKRKIRLNLNVDNPNGRKADTYIETYEGKKKN